MPSSTPRRFGLERYEDPGLDHGRARPLWSASIDPKVLCAEVHNVSAPWAERVDLRVVAPLVSIAVDEEEIEHVLVSDGVWSLRLDIVNGTLIGCPASLAYRLTGLSMISESFDTLTRLVALMAGSGPCTLRPSPRRARWIQELQVADAIQSGASQQEIARGIFGSAISPTGWRTKNEPYRSRTQRLMRAARQRLITPLDPIWFARR